MFRRFFHRTSRVLLFLWSLYVFGTIWAALRPGIEDPSNSNGVVVAGTLGSIVAGLILWAPVAIILWTFGALTKSN